MTVAKKGQERLTYAWMYRVQARKNYQELQEYGELRRKCTLTKTQLLIDHCRATDVLTFDASWLRASPTDRQSPSNHK